MAVSKDPLTSYKSLPLSPSESMSESPYGEGLIILELTEKQVARCGDFISDFYKKRREIDDLRVTRTAPTMLKGAIFALGTERQHNPEWKEHCATSLREIFHEWKILNEISSDFSRYYRNDKPLNSYEKEIFKDFKNHYDYFTGIDHHNTSKIQNSLIAILKDNSLKPEDCLKREVFIERVKEFFRIIANIIEISGWPL